MCWGHFCGSKVSSPRGQPMNAYLVSACMANALGQPCVCYCWPGLLCGRGSSKDPCCTICCSPCPVLLCPCQPRPTATLAPCRLLGHRGRHAAVLCRPQVHTASVCRHWRCVLSLLAAAAWLAVPRCCVHLQLPRRSIPDSNNSIIPRRTDGKAMRSQLLVAPPAPPRLPPLHTGRRLSGRP